jgi:hypothetical protein
MVGVERSLRTSKRLMIVREHELYGAYQAKRSLGIRARKSLQYHSDLQPVSHGGW